MTERHVGEKSGLLSFLNIYWYSPLPGLPLDIEEQGSSCNPIICDLYLHLHLIHGALQFSKTEQSQFWKAVGLLEVLLGDPKEGLYNSAEQNNSVWCLSVCLWDQSYNRLIPF